MKLGFRFFLLLPKLAFAAKCSLLSSEAGPPITFELPESALSHPLLDLPIEFRGLSPIVTRSQLKHGEKPKVILQRYSEKPDIYYDEMSGSVIVSTSTCEGDPSDGSGSGAGVQGSDSGVISPSTKNSLVIGASALLGVLTSNPWMTGAALAAGLAQTAEAQDTCDPVVQVLVQAPAAYKGAYEVCMEEINDPAICFDPFPTYPTCDDPMPTCEVAVVGGGAGGLYAALRMVDEGKVDASNVCVFEMTERVGGRLFSLRGLGPDDDLVVDAGGYRTWPEFTPTLHALITEYLGIPMDCYDDSDPCAVYNIVDENGKKAGFATFVEEMMQRLSDGGACFYPYHELTSLKKIDDLTTELYFANGVTATSTLTTILNVPQRPLLNIIRNSGFDTAGLLDADTLDALHSVQTVIATKLYLYYPRGSAFWLKLGLPSGDFESDGDARSMLLGGRYHDGQIECDDDNDPDTCHGFLLAVYVNDLSGNKAQFFRRYQRERPEPVTIISDKNLEGSELLKHAHSRLLDYHLYEKTDAPYTGFQAAQILEGAPPPTFGILSTWNVAIPWAGGAWHAWTDTRNIERAKQPFSQENIFVINEAYSLLQGWAEGSVKVADEILEEHFGIARPWDFPVVDLNQIVRQTNSEECVEADTGGAAADGDAGGSGGGDASGAVLCFTGESLVSMGDGSLKAIRDVREGDIVMTGAPGVVGRVTEKLVHDVGRVVPVAVVQTEHGELVGTPDHPVLESSSGWIELASLSHPGGISLEARHVSTFYNLEVDGHLVLNDVSSHSYIVNGVTASGLGDNEELNLRFPRQEVWKEIAAT